MRRILSHLLPLILIIAIILPITSCGNLGVGATAPVTKRSVAIITQNTTVSTTYSYYSCNAGSRSIWLTFPAPIAASAGCEWIVIRTDSNASNVVYINATVNGQTNNLLASQYQSMIIESDGVGYYAIPSNSSGSITPTLVSIAVTPYNVPINVSATQQFIATGTYSSGPSQNLTASTTWVSSNTSVGTVVQHTGVATGVLAGYTNITCSLGAITSNIANLTVVGSLYSLNYGLDTNVNPNTDNYTLNLNNISWYNSSNFSFVYYRYSQGIAGNNFSGYMKAAGKDVLLYCEIWNGALTGLTWGDLYDSWKGNGTYYNTAITYITTCINAQGAGNIKAFNFGDEIPYDVIWPGGTVNYTKVIAVHNQIYTALKSTFPTLNDYFAGHIQYFNDTQMASILRDGLIDDNYSVSAAETDVWLKNMVKYNGSNSYALLHASGNYDNYWLDPTGSTTSGYAKLTPDVLYQQVQIAKADGISHLFFYSGDEQSGNFMFNATYSVPLTTDPNSASDGYQFNQAILNIINGTANIHSQDIRIAATTDDAGTRTQSNTSFDASSGSDYIGDWGGVQTSEGLRFLNLTIPSIGSLRLADLRLYSAGDVPTPNNVTIKVYGQSAATPLTFNSTIANFTSRTNTTANVMYKFPAVVGIDGDQVKPNINVTSIVSELNGAYSFSSGHALAFKLFGWPSGGGTTNYTSIIAYEAEPDYCSGLTVDWTLPIYTLNYTAGGNGTIRGTSLQHIGYGDYGFTVLAVPNAGYSFINWSDGSLMNPRIDSNVIANITVTANFAQ